MTDVFQVQSDIATKVAQALGGALGAGEEKRLSEKPTQNLAAYDAFLKGEEISECAGSQRSAQPCARRSASTSRPWRWIPVSRRRGRGSRCADSLLYANSTPTPALAERARRGGGEGRRARAEPPRGVPGARQLRTAGLSTTTTARWSSTRRGCASRPATPPLLRATALAEQGLGTLGCGGGALQAGRAPRSAVGLTHRGPRRRAPLSAALSRGARGVRPGPRPRARQHQSDRGQGHDAISARETSPVPGPCSRPRRRRSSPPRSWPTWRPTTISSGSSTRSSESFCCG